MMTSRPFCIFPRAKVIQNAGALALKAQKYGSSRIKRSKVIKSWGALALNAQTSLESMSSQHFTTSSQRLQGFFHLSIV